MSAPALIVVIGLAFVGSFIGQPRSASAAGENPSIIEANQRALKLGYEADELYARGQWEGAFQRFSEANALAYSPVFILYMARCRKNAGRLIEAEAVFTELEKKSLGEDAPRPFRDAVRSAAIERAEVSRRIPRARITLSGGGDAVFDTVRLRVDGKLVSGQPQQLLSLDPGIHTFDVNVGSRTGRREVFLADGAGEVSVVIEVAERNGGSEPHRVGLPAILSLSVGLVSLAVGGVTFALAADKGSSVKDSCVDGHCRKSDAERLDDARSLADVSTGAFIAAGVGLAAAGLLLLVRPSQRTGRPVQSLASIERRESSLGLMTSF